MFVLPDYGKILALDLGTRRTGVAVSDVQQRVAFARPEVEHERDEDLLEWLRAFVVAEGVSGIVVGYPVKLSGEATEQTRKVEVTCELLSDLDLPIELMDERLSTQAAEDLKGFVTREKHSDSRAAQILLETYLSKRA